MIGKVTAIFIAPDAGAKPAAVDSATLASGKGILGDRYARQAGTFSAKLRENNDWEVTLIEAEEIQRYNETQEVVLSPGDFRRNIITSGVRLNDLQGQRFIVGEALLEGVRLCEPCAYLGSLLGPGVVKAMKHRAGLRARIIQGALIRPGDPIGIESGMGSA